MYNFLFVYFYKFKDKKFTQYRYWNLKTLQRSLRVMKF